MMETTTKKRYPRAKTTRIGDAAALQQRIAAGQVTPRETQQFQRMMKEFRRKFINGQLSPQTARQFGID